MINIFFLKIYQRLTGKTIGPIANAFFQNISHTFWGFGLSMVIMFIINIFAARILGPFEYGNYTLVITISQFLMVPMMLGLNSALTRYLSKDSTQSRDLAGTALIAVLFLSYFFGALFFLFQNGFSQLFNTSPLIFMLANLYAISFNLKRISEAVFRGLHQFKKQARWEVAMAIIIGLAFLFFVILNPDKNFIGYINALMAGYIIYAIAAFIGQIRQRLNFKKSWLKIILAFGVLSLGANISAFILGHMDRLMINFFMNTESLGFYMAYFTASLAIWARIMTMLINVIFPFAAQSGKQNSMFNKLVLITKKTGLPLLIIIVLSTSILILFYGKQYPFRVDWILLFSIQALFYIFWTTAWWLIASEGRKGVQFTSLHSFIGASINIILNLILIPLWGINGALIATIVSSLYFIALAKHYFSNYQK